MSDKEKVSLPELDFLTTLNKEQKQAVLYLDGPLLVLSGAGTGKTKVLTTRLANLIFSRKAKTSEIFAVTFTNKAALEMKLRVEKLIKRPIEGMFIGTFHSIGVRLLRKHAELLSLKSDFTILDTDDQLRLLKQVIKLLDLDTKKFVPKNYLYFQMILASNSWLSIKHTPTSETISTTTNTPRKVKMGMAIGSVPILSLVITGRRATS